MASEAIRPDGVVILEISPPELMERLQRGDPLVLVDVREPFERMISDLPNHGQLSLPVKFIQQAISRLSPEDEVVVYCRSGPRSAWAAEQLMHMGFRKVLNLRGGILAWREQVDPSLKAY